MSEAKPDWLRVKAPTGDGFGNVRSISRSCGLRTVCDASHCPNISDCWSRGHATFLIMGPSCTRNCAFCAVEHGHPSPLDPTEPNRVASAVRALALSYVVVTSVTRDDLEDGGATQFSAVVRTIREASPSTRIELLIPDMGASKIDIATVVGSAPDVIGHNIEVVRRLQSVARDHRSSYDRSLSVLASIKAIEPRMLTKSSLMLGLGESYDEVVEALRDLRGSGVDAVTLGQYLKPKGGVLEVSEYVLPETFRCLREEASAIGFKFVASAPLVRSSYNAHRLFEVEEENHAL